jgi:hypothetical protein
MGELARYYQHMVLSGNLDLRKCSPCPASNAHQARRADESLLAERNPTKVGDAD